jgi:hypothetical protein
MTHTHVTAPTQFVEANGIRFAYRRFGRETREPLLLMQHCIALSKPGPLSGARQTFSRSLRVYDDS